MKRPARSSAAAAAIAGEDLPQPPTGSQAAPWRQLLPFAGEDKRRKVQQPDSGKGDEEVPETTAASAAHVSAPITDSASDTRAGAGGPPTHGGCRHPKCSYRSHSVRDFDGYCCGRCKLYHDEGRSWPAHGQRCEMVLMPKCHHPDCDRRAERLTPLTPGEELFCCFQCRWSFKWRVWPTHAPLCDKRHS